MLRIIHGLLMLVIFSPIFTQQVFAGDGGPLFVKIDYFKAAPGGTGDYVNLEREIWKPLHEERYSRGIIKSWNFYQVMAGEPDVPYQFIAVNVFDDYDMIDYFDLEDIMETVYPDKKPEDLMKQTHASREVVRTEIWQVDGKIIPDEATVVSGNYLTVNYFDSRGGSGEHMEMELDFWGPIHETRIDKDILNSWTMYTLLYPGGDARIYTYSTIDYYESLGDMREPVGVGLAQVAHAGLSDEEIDDFFNRTGASRSLFKTELWKRLDFVGDQSGYLGNN